MATEIDPELIARINYEFETLGHMTAETLEKYKAATAGVKEFEMKMNLATKATGALYQSFTTYNRAVYDGIKGYKDLAATTDSLATSIEAVTAALAFVLPIGRAAKIAVAAFGLLAGEATRFSKVIGEQADNLRKGFDGLAEAGATAGDGMTGVFESLQRLGLGVQEADHMVRLLGDNAQTVSLFGGTMKQGSRVFENTVDSMKPMAADFLSLGIQFKDFSTVGMNYLKIQKMMTMGTREQMDTSGAAVKRYVEEMDEMTRLTGLSRKKQEQILEDAYREEAFAAKMDDLRARAAEAKASGNKAEETRLNNAVDMYEKGLRHAAATSTEMAEAYMTGVSGFVGNSEKSIALFQASNGKIQELNNNIEQGAIKTDADLARSFRGVNQSVGEFGKTFRQNYMAKAMGGFGVSYETTRKAAERANMSLEDYNKTLKTAKKEQDEQTGKEGEQDEILLRYNQLLINANKEMLKSQKAVQDMMPGYMGTVGGTTSAMQGLTNAAMAAAEALGIIGGKKTTSSGPGSTGGRKVDIGGTKDPRTTALATAQKVLDEQNAILESKKKERIETDEKLDLAKKEKVDAFRTGKSTAEIAEIDARITKFEKQRSEILGEITKQETAVKISTSKRDVAQAEQNNIVRDHAKLQRDAKEAEQKIIDARKENYEIETKQNKEIQKAEEEIAFFEKRRAEQKGYLNRMDSEALRIAKQQLDRIKSSPQKKIEEAQAELENINAQIRETEQQLNVPGKATLSDLISRGESRGAGEYNAANYEGGKKIHKGGIEGLSQMSIGDVMAKQADRSVFAAGRYQITPETMQGAVKALGLKPSDKFDAATQDRIFNEYLIGSKRKNVSDYLKSGGKGDVDAAALDLAKEFASVGVPKDMVVDDKFGRRELKAGEGYYAGVGGNPRGPASISPDEIKAVLAQMIGTQVASAEEKPRMADGGIVNAKPGGTEVIVGEAGVSEAVIPLKGGAVPVSLSMIGGGAGKLINGLDTLVDKELTWAEKVMEIVKTVNPTIRVAASLYETAKSVNAAYSTKTAMLPDADLAAKKSASETSSAKESPGGDMQSVSQTEIVNALKESTEINKAMSSMMAEMVQQQKNSNNTQEKMLRYTQN